MYLYFDKRHVNAIIVFFPNISPWKGYDPLIEQTWTSLNQVRFEPSLFEHSPLVLESKILKCCQCILIIFSICRKGMWYFICINLNPLYPNMLWAKLGWNWLIHLRKENLSMYLWSFAINSDWKNEWPYNKHESIPITKWCSVLNLV